MFTNEQEYQSFGLLAVPGLAHLFYQHKQTAYTPICDGLQFQSKIRVGLLLGVNSKQLASSIIYVSYYSTLT